MRLPRIIPVLLLTESGVVKTVKFRDSTYVGDPINALRIFNEKEVDEVVVLDISATREGRSPDIDRVGHLAAECFMPLAYGGGVTGPRDAEKLFSVGVEKVIINSTAAVNPSQITEISALAGSQSTVGSIDVKKSWLGRYQVVTHCGTKAVGADPAEWARRLEDLGCGEILLNSIDRDGTMSGFDLELVGQVARAVKIPVVACGGAGSIRHFREVVAAGASAAAAGSMFVFYGKHRAVLINYPTRSELLAAFKP